MGFTPAQVDAMSAWEFFACCEGYSAAHGGKAEGGGSGRELDEQELRDMGIMGF